MQIGAEIDNLQWTGRAPKTSDSLTRERLIEIYEVELRQAFDDLGDDFDLGRDSATNASEPEIMASSTDPTVNELLFQFLKHAQEYYDSREYGHFMSVARMLRR